MKKIIGNLTINDLLDYFKNKCEEIDCDTCPFEEASCGSSEYILKKFVEDVGENALIEVEDE